MLTIRPDQIAALDAAFGDEQRRRLLARNACHAPDCDPRELTDAALEAGYTYDLSTDDELERLSDVFATFATLGREAFEWREATMHVLTDSARPGASRLDFIEKHILPRLRDDHG